MALSAYERKVLSSIPNDRKEEIVVKYTMAIARQIRSSLRAKYSEKTITEQILSTTDLVRQSDKEVLVLPTEDERKYIVFVNKPDQPFIVDTCRIHLRSLGAQNIVGFNAIVALKRNDEGTIVAVDQPQDQLESIIRFEIEGDFQVSPG